MNLDEMTVKQLRELGRQMGIDLTGKTRKEELLEAIENAKDAESEAAPEPEDTAEDAPEPEDTAEDAEPEAAPEPEDTAEDAPEPEQKGYMVYVGPSLPGGLLPHGKILYGTQRTIRDYLEPVTERLPEAWELLVPVSGLEQAMRDVKNPKKRLYHKAQELKDNAKRHGG